MWVYGELEAVRAEEVVRDVRNWVGMAECYPAKRKFWDRYVEAILVGRVFARIYRYLCLCRIFHDPLYRLKVARGRVSFLQPSRFTNRAIA